MEATLRYIKQLREPSQKYALLISLAGVILFAATTQFSLFSYSLSEWVMVYAMVAAVLVLQHFMFRLPPEGNAQSMDSSIFLACVFVFGGGFSQTILLLSSIVFFLQNLKIAWWKQFLNFSIYSIMISGASITFQLLMGEQGEFDINQLPAYFLSLSIYFIINVLLVGIYYFLLYKGKLFQIIKDILQESLFAYLSTLLLSLVLVTLVTQNGLFGLFLFLAIAVLLSHAFRQIFNMYNDMSEKANKDQRTGLFNHSYFEEKLDTYIKNYRELEATFSIALLDLDDFKKYNDAFGHPQGDQLLSFFGKVVKEECDLAGIVASRYGGEEFALILPGLHMEQAFDFVNGLRKKINDSPFGGVDVFPHGCISFSAGVVEMDQEIYDKTQLVVMADKALYAAKSKGKNTVWTFGEQNSLSSGVSLESDINEIEQLVKVFLTKDVYTFKHSKRVFSYSVDMAGVLNLNEVERRVLILGALIHDIGKLEIPRDVLNKKGKLTEDEWDMIKKHVTWGKEMLLSTGKFKELIPLVELHHERYDGKGYPYGLKGHEIPKLARLLCIIDSFDAMTTERPYQQTKSFDEAIYELSNHAGTQFDPELVGPFVLYIQSKYHLHDAESQSAASVEDSE